MSIPIDIDLYNLAKQEADRIYKKPSAYKSGFIVKKYKELGGRYIGEKNILKGLNRWFSEQWTNQRGEEGYKYKSDIYRPNFRITDETPITFDELTEQDLNRSRRKKYTKGRVNKFRSS